MPELSDIAARILSKHKIKSSAQAVFWACNQKLPDGQTVLEAAGGDNSEPINSTVNTDAKIVVYELADMLFTEDTSW